MQLGRNLSSQIGQISCFAADPLYTILFSIPSTFVRLILINNNTDAYTRSLINSISACDLERESNLFSNALKLI